VLPQNLYWTLHERALAVVPQLSDITRIYTKLKKGFVNVLKSSLK